MDPYDPTDSGRSFKAIETAYRSLLPFRELNRGLVEEYVGAAYGPPGRAGRHDDYLNLMNQAVDAYEMALVANRPRVLVTTENQTLEYFAHQYQLAINNLIKEIGLEYTLKRWVLDAFFCIGIIKIHRADSGEVQILDDMWMDVGRPFVSNVSVDNYVYDLGATKYSQVKFAGDMYRIPFSKLKDPCFDQDATKDIIPTSKYGVEELRLEMISRGYEVDHDELEPMTDLADVWMPEDHKVYTFAVDNVSQFRLKGIPLAVMDDDEYSGAGPYELLGFNQVPENIMPTSPASHLSMLHKLTNNLMRKQARRARSQKKVHAYSPAGAGGAVNLQKANDDEWVQVLDPREINEVTVGGVDPNTQAFLLDVISKFDRQAGNLTAMLGLGAQAGTVGQEELIKQSVSTKEGSMQFKVVDGSVRVIHRLGCMLWHDKFKVIESQIPIEGAEGYAVDASWTPDDREGRFSDYSFDIDLYSMPYQSPGQKVQALNSLLKEIYAPLGQLLTQQGGSINLEKLTALYSEFLSLPRLKDIVQFTMAPTADSGQQDEPDSRMPQATTRNYVRKSVPSGGTVEGRSQAQQQAWLGKGQPGARAGMQPSQ